MNEEVVLDLENYIDRMCDGDVNIVLTRLYDHPYRDTIQVSVLQAAAVFVEHNGVKW